MSAAWKALERRVAAELGGRRSGPLGAAVSDIVGVPWSTEVKRCKTPSVRTAWITQAQTQGRKEGLPWILVVAGHNDRRPTVTLDFGEFVEIARQAGLIPKPAAKPASLTADRVPLARSPGGHRPRSRNLTPTKGANLRHETETTTEPDVPQPPDEPEPDEPDTDDDDDEAEQ